jgi:hypothetical protein
LKVCFAARSKTIAFRSDPWFLLDLKPNLTTKTRETRDLGAIPTRSPVSVDFLHRSLDYVGEWRRNQDLGAIPTRSPVSVDFLHRLLDYVGEWRRNQDLGAIPTRSPVSVGFLHRLLDYVGEETGDHHPNLVH